MKVPIKVDSGRILLLDAEELYFLEANGDDTLVRTAGRRRYQSVESLGEWEERLAGAGFIRIHRSYLVNLDRVREVRVRKEDPNAWEVKLDPPVNAVLPVGRSRLAGLRAAVGLE